MPELDQNNDFLLISDHVIYAYNQIHRYIYIYICMYVSTYHTLYFETQPNGFLAFIIASALTIYILAALSKIELHVLYFRLGSLPVARYEKPYRPGT